MQVIAEEPWLWMLFSHEEALFMSVVCGSTHLYVVNLRLTPFEADAFLSRGDAFLAGLARDVSYQSEKYADRHLADFQGMPGVKEAAMKWRSERAAGP